jgi:hypothetical protein
MSDRESEMRGERTDERDRDERVHERDERVTEGRATDGGEERLSTADLVREPDDEERHVDAGAGNEERQPLFAGDDAERFRGRWSEVQTQFVDDPRRAVEDADALVAELMQRLAETFASERSELERQWDGGGDVSTEDLRIALQRYRSFFDRLLSA